jgi:hypothetical protein
MSDDFKTRMLRRHPAVSKRSSTLAVPDTEKQQDNGSQQNKPAFDIPIEGETMTLDSLVALSRNGDSVPMPMSREMTAQELDAIQAGQVPSMRLTKLEHDTLTKLGWKDGEPIPPDFSAELRNTFTQYVEQKQAEGIPLEKIKIGQIEDLPESEQVRLQNVMRVMIEGQKTRQAVTATTAKSEQLEVYPDSIRQVLAGVDLSPSIVSSNPKQKTTDNSVPIKQSISQQETIPEKREIPVTTCQTCGHDPYKSKQKIVCSHCGGDPLENLNEKEIPVDDKRRFLIALGTKRPFEKEYSFFGDTIKVRFRTLRNREFDELPIWAVKKAASEKLLAPQDMVARVRYLELLGSVVLQTKLLQSSLANGELFWSAPDVPYPTFKDWGVENMDELVDHFLDEIPSEAVIVALQQQLTKFNELDIRLRREARNTTNFWAET